MGTGPKAVSIIGYSQRALIRLTIKAAVNGCGPVSPAG
ncbi:hypothetical protein BJ964_001348 [Actinoplanes lobatus]|uniref:Uncharacterized protein n=1 Tax=Actinoplanes lobatus TaxID=113568 RepID=A0A7W7HBN1_9ACTN|nr:hypothetical protein [Actinoplanes lobatus]